MKTLNPCSQMVLLGLLASLSFPQANQAQEFPQPVSQLSGANSDGRGVRYDLDSLSEVWIVNIPAFERVELVPGNENFVEIEAGGSIKFSKYYSPERGFLHLKMTSMEVSERFPKVKVRIGCKQLRSLNLFPDPELEEVTSFPVTSTGPLRSEELYLRLTADAELDLDIDVKRLFMVVEAMYSTYTPFYFEVPEKRTTKLPAIRGKADYADLYLRKGHLDLGSLQARQISIDAGPGIFLRVGSPEVLRVFHALHDEEEMLGLGVVQYSGQPELIEWRKLLNTQTVRLMKVN